MRETHIRRTFYRFILLLAVGWLAAVSSPGAIRRPHADVELSRGYASLEEAIDSTIPGAYGGAAPPMMAGGGLAQEAYLKASNTDGLDHFGLSVAIDGDTAVVGARAEDSSATGVNGNAADGSSTDAGAAYVFVRSGGVWTHQAYLKASNTGAGDLFGVSVAISGDTIVVGANGEDSNATGVNGNQSDNSKLQSGAAYVFVRNGTTWTQQAYLKASNTGANSGGGVGGGDNFGNSVAISGDTIAVGAQGEDSIDTGINGNQADNTAQNAGAVYMFVRSGTTWTQQAYIKASNTDGALAGRVYGDVFARSLAIDGDTLVVGAANEFGTGLADGSGGGEDSSAVGINGNQSDDSALESGAAYVFVRTGTAWSQQAYLKASNTGIEDRFGFSVAVSGNTIVVGAYREDSAAAGVGGSGSDNSAADSGAAYVYVRSGTAWTQQAYLKASNTGAGDRFGWSVAISDDRIVVGSPLEDSNATGVNGNQSNNSFSESGAAYVFSRAGTAWTQEAYLKASNTDAGDNFGWAVAVSGDTILAGAFAEDSGATGVNGIQGNANNASGAAYIFATAANQTPDADAGSDQFVFATSASGATVTLTGSASSDPDGDALTYAWSEGATALGTGAVVTPTLALGTHTLTLTVTDTGGLQSTDTVSVEVRDALSVTGTTPPPAPAATYTYAQAVPASYSCGSSAGLLASCVGTVANGANIDTSTLGSHAFTVTATNTLGDTTSVTWTYDVVAAPSTVTVTCPATTTYSGAAQTPCTATVTGAGGLNLTATPTYANNVNAGLASASYTYPGDATHTGSGGSGGFNILTKPVTATLTANSKVYDGTTAEPDAAMSCALSGVAAGDIGTVGCAASGGSFDNPNVGSPRVVAATITLSGSAAGNYTLGAAGTSVTSIAATNAATSTSASVVYGQLGSFTSATANTGGVSAASLASPRGVTADAAGNIYVADITNHRILFFPFGQTTATRVYGQAGSFTTTTANNGGVTANSLSNPNRVTVDGTGLYVSDNGNRRVLYFSGSSTTATRVFGQGGSFTSSGANTGGVSADSLASTGAIAIDAGGNVYIADSGNHRVLFYPAGSTTATRVYGQNGSFTTNLANNTGGVGGVVSADSLRSPNGIRLDTAGNLYVADFGNNRVLVFPAGQTTATAVYGQNGSFTTDTANNGGVGAASLNGAVNLALDGGNNLYIADTSNHRVLYYQSGQTTAAAVYGQAGSFTTNVQNNGGVSADSLRSPNSVDLDFAGNIYISDQGNNRVLRFNASAPAITPATLVITASSGTKVPGTVATITPGYSGFVYGETSSVLSAPPVCTSAGAGASAAPGTYATACSGAAADNYAISYVSGTLTVTTSPLIATLTAAGKIYDGTTAASDASLSCTLSGVLAGDAGNVTCTATGGSFDSAAAGPRTVTATVTIGGSAAGSYTLGAAGTLVTSASATASATIAAKPASVTPDAASKVYGGIDPPLTGTLSGFLPTDGVTAVYARTAGETVAGSPYTISATLAPAEALSNYTITANTASFTITQASSSTVVSCTPSVVYSGAAQEVCTATVTGAGGLNESIAVSYTNNTTVGTANASATYAGDANHDGSSGSATFAITPAASSTVVSCTPSVVYNGSAQEVCTATVTGVGGLNAPVPVTYTNNTTVGTASASATYAGDGNHDNSSGSATFAIAKKSASVTIASATKIYGSPDPVFTGSLSGFIPSDAVTAAYSRGAGEAVGSYAIAPTLSPTGVLGNYDISYNSAALTITQATLSVTADAKSKLLGAADPAFTYTATGFQFTDTAASVLTGSLTRDAGEAVGSYTIRQGTLAANGNYAIAFTTGTLTIGYNTCLLYDPSKGVKSGATIPIKIRLCSASGVNASASTIVVTATHLTLETTATSGVVDDAGSANPEGNFRFDTGLGPGYIFNLKTTGLVKGTWRLHFTVTGDPQPHLVRFQVQ